jgi:hypothetical protein|tara:strand:- start:266 stop:400 length:135 start_codon:yes stop_codon:yes gene_type:complete
MMLSNACVRIEPRGAKVRSIPGALIIKVGEDFRFWYGLDFGYLT